MSTFIQEPAARLNVVASYDVVVVGGGIAGVSAAVSAAREGASVCLLEREYALGGLATLGLVWCYLPLDDGFGHQIMGSIAEELLKLSVADGYSRIPPCWAEKGSPESRRYIRYEVEFNPASFMILLDKFVQDSGAHIRFGSQFCQVLLENGEILAVIVEEKAGRRAILCHAVVDASGDACVCQRAGEETSVVSNNRLAHWYACLEGEKYHRYESQVSLSGSLPQGMRLYDGVETLDETDFMLEGRRRIGHEFIKKARNHASFLPILLPTLPQIRMSRHLVGKETLHLSDCGRWFDSCVGMIADWREKGRVYSVPYGTLCARNITNLWAAGRNISAQSDAGDVIRSIPACAVTGEAAGAAAALHTSDHTKFSVSCLQKALLKRGALIDKSLIDQRFFQ